MNRKLLTYGPVVLLALLCAAAFATGVLTRYPVLEAQVQAMDFPNGTAVSLENGDVYGVVPSGGPGHSLSAGTYRLKWFVDGDGDNALHLYSENGVKMEPETVILPAGQFEGEFEFTLDSAISGLQLQFEFAAGTYMEIYDVRIYTPGCSDNAFTLLFASLAFSLIWVAVRRGRLRTAQIEGMLMIGLAVLFASAPAFQETLHIGDDIQYHLCRIENIVDAWQCGQFPARLGAYMYDGYGALTSVFYPDYALYPFALMRLCGASLAYVGNMLLISLNIGAAAGMYAAAKRMFGGGRAAAAASTLYVLAAYRLTDVYARFAVGEALAMVFLPLFIAALWDCVAGDKNRWKALALSAAAIFLSHMITTLLCALMALLLCLMNARRILREKRLANLLKAAGLCLLLVLFHLAPMLMYIREGLGASDLMRDVSYSSIRPAELLSSNGRFAVQIGLPLMLGAALAAEAVCKRGKIGEKERAADAGAGRRGGGACGHLVFPVELCGGADGRAGELHPVPVAAACADGGAAGACGGLSDCRNAGGTSETGRGSRAGAFRGGGAAAAPSLCGRRRNGLRRRHQPAPDQRGISHSGFVSDADGQPGICGERRRFGDE